MQKFVLVGLIGLLGCAAHVRHSRALRNSATEAAASDAKMSESDLRILRSADYEGGAVYVFDVRGEQVAYECVDGGCLRACPYTPVASHFEGTGQMLGDHAAPLRVRAAAEFDCPDSRIIQMGHVDRKGGGLYVLEVCGNEVKYACEGPGCRLVCD